MNRTTAVGKLLGLLISLVPALSLAAPEPFDVEAKVVQEGDAYRLEIVSGGNCNTPGTFGCVEPEKDAVITFRLLDPPSGWGFNGVYVCLSDEPVKPRDCTLNKLERLQFPVTRENTPVIKLPQKNGVTYVHDIPGEETTFKLYNANNSSSNYYYILRACKPASGPDKNLCARSDPPIKNKGRGSNR